jgi:hypothetical protein
MPLPPKMGVADEVTRQGLMLHSAAWRSLNIGRSKMATLTRKQLVWIGCALGAAYGVFARAVFALDKRGDLFAVMSSSFIFGVPVALGFVTVWCGEYRESYGWARRVLTPWVASLACLGCCLALVWEGLICIWLWLPLVLILSSLGGLLAGLLRYFFPSRRSKTYCLAVVALTPFLVAPLESLRTAASEVRTVHTSIEVSAGPDAVWHEIRSVRKIEAREQSFAFSHLLGFPRPIEAVLEGEGVGAIRYARFEGGVLFIERITEWQERERLSFSIHADAKNIPPTTFDEHVTIGGRYFDVLRGSYWIEKLAPNRVLLHLSSDQRLSTGFNIYSHLWTEALMADLQNDILRIIRKRCEVPNPPPQPAPTSRGG